MRERKTVTVFDGIKFVTGHFLQVLVQTCAEDAVQHLVGLWTLPFPNLHSFGQNTVLSQAAQLWTACPPDGNSMQAHLPGLLMCAVKLGKDCLSNLDGAINAVKLGQWLCKCISPHPKLLHL